MQAYLSVLSACLLPDLPQTLLSSNSPRSLSFSGPIIGGVALNPPPRYVKSTTISSA